MQFHLNHKPIKTEFTIKHSDKIVLMGSCFVENIGALLHENKFNSFLNPNGIIFNPQTIYDIIKRSINEIDYDTRIVLKHHHLFFSYLHHSSINEISETGLIKKINIINHFLNKYLAEADFLILTFGSAFAYFHNELSLPVANCHKQPSNHFQKQLIDLNSIVSNYVQLINQLLQINPKLKLIFTVSPVKYLKDGLEENFISKSTLRLAIHQIISQTKNTYYFSAYELVSDDLRDYRFYKEDLAHPNEQAINYVWEKFGETYFNIETLELNKQITKLNQALNHRVLQPEKEELIKHQNYILRLKEEIKSKYPFFEI
ncbi:MAG: GSCFA domain-containing protein [Bacteroidota bacterium]|nr:GSCFA domain-containing protein [Bacteroidota bacterium]